MNKKTLNEIKQTLKNLENKIGESFIEKKELEEIVKSVNNINDLLKKIADMTKNCNTSIFIPSDPLERCKVFENQKENLYRIYDKYVSSLNYFLEKPDLDTNCNEKESLESYKSMILNKLDTLSSTRNVMDSNAKTRLIVLFNGDVFLITPKERIFLLRWNDADGRICSATYDCWVQNYSRKAYEFSIELLSSKNFPINSYPVLERFNSYGKVLDDVIDSLRHLHVFTKCEIASKLIYKILNEMSDCDKGLIVSVFRGIYISENFSMESIITCCNKEIRKRR